MIRLISLLLFVLPSGMACATDDFGAPVSCEGEKCDEAPLYDPVTIEKDGYTLHLEFTAEAAIVTFDEVIDSGEEATDKEPVTLRYVVPKSSIVLRCPCTVYVSSIFYITNERGQVSINTNRLGLMAQTTPYIPTNGPVVDGQTVIFAGDSLPLASDYLSLIDALYANNAEEEMIHLDAVTGTGLEEYLVNSFAGEDTDVPLRIYIDDPTDLDLVDSMERFVELLNLYVFRPTLESE